MGDTLISEQMTLFPENETPNKADTTSTFEDNLSLPIHRWFRYSAGFSALWVQQLIERERRNSRTHVIDPFAGSGTVLLAGELAGIEAMGVEAHPFVARVARSKLFWREDPTNFQSYARAILERAKQIAPNTAQYPDLIQRCFPVETLSRLDTLREAWQASADRSPLSELSWLALVTILRKCSPVGTAQWQYVLPNKTKANPIDPYSAYEATISSMSNDMARRQLFNLGQQAILHQEDARLCTSITDGWADLIITSPPYANNYDYADATRLEMTFFGDVRGWGDLQDAVRKHLVRACTQHVAKQSGETAIILEDRILEPIRSEIVAACEKLQVERETRAGKKPYHTMIAAYFQDMAEVWHALRRITSEDCLVCFVIGDSAPYGVHIPVADWMGELAVAAGFKSYSFEKTRDRNVKWKNRKHRVPLYEGRLWVRG